VNGFKHVRIRQYIQRRCGHPPSGRVALYDPPGHRKKLKAAGLDLCATQALIALKTVRVVDIDLGGRATKRSVTRSCVRGQVMKDTPPTLASGVQGRALERPVHAKRQSDEAFN
jgi:hypothetical protein